MNVKLSNTYHEAKDKILKEIEPYRISSEGELLPEVEVTTMKKEWKSALSKTYDDIINIKFRALNPDFYNMLKYSSGMLGDVNIKKRMFGSLILESNSGLKIVFDENDFAFKGEGIYANKSIQISKDKSIDDSEIEAIIELYKMGNSVQEIKNPEYELMMDGVKVYKPNKMFSWDYLAGYQDIKDAIRDTIILPLKNSKVFDDITKGTRKKVESNRPKAVLFEGPPGTGKTTSARIIAGDINAPLVYVPLESIMTKWYGESERNLARIFENCKAMGNTVMFLDEIESLGASRDGNTHEATRRVLSVLLRKIDGFEVNDKTILIGATNRKNDLDAALLSRFDRSLYFRIPNDLERKAIFGNYAKHLENPELEILASQSNNLSGRNIKDVCEDAERRWASKIIRKEVDKKELPNTEEYIGALKSRASEIEFSKEVKS
ncbi:MAG: ATP-binding protein [archaeon]